MRCLLFFLLYVAVTAFASDRSSCLCDCFPSKKDHCRISVRDTEGGGIGYSQGYATCEGFFAPHPHPESLMPFVDCQGHVFKNGYIAANTGVGIRGILGNRIYGFNSYYDFRDSKNIHYTQTGLGFETLGQSWDFRLNGYLPLGKKTVPLEAFESENPPLAMKGVDAEIGFHCPFFRRFGLYAAMSPYYYVGEIGSPTWGGKARLKGELSRYLTFEASHSYDQTFHNNFQLQLTFTLPLEGKSYKSKTSVHHKNCLEALRARMVQLVVREEIIVAKNNDKDKAQDSVTAETVIH